MVTALAPLVDRVLSGIPQPPVHDAMPKTAELVFDAFIFIPLGVALVIALRHIAQGRGPLLLFCILGGALACSFEPIVDVLGQVYLKELGAHGTFTILGRTMPLYICFVYPWYVGGMGYLAYRLFDQGVTAKNLFQLWALDAVVDVFLELPGIIAKTYLYYGHQPLKVFGFPLWWAMVNPVMPMLAGALLFFVIPRLGTSPGWRLLAIVPLIPMADGIANAAAGWPMWIALNIPDQSYLWTYLGCAATLTLSLYCVWIIGLAVGRTESTPTMSIFGKLRGLFTPPAATPTPSGALV